VGPLLLRASEGISDEWRQEDSMNAKLAIKGGKRTVPAGLEKPWPPITQAEINAVVRVLKRGVLWGPMEEEVLGLAREFADYIGVKHALVVNSGTAALHACVWAPFPSIHVSISWRRALPSLAALTMRPNILSVRCRWSPMNEFRWTGFSLTAYL